MDGDSASKTKHLSCLVKGDLTDQKIHNKKQN